MILAIDPGNTMSAFVLMDGYRPIEFRKIENDALLEMIPMGAETVVIEQIACYGMPVGKEVFDTCVWSGRFMQTAIQNGANVHFLPRSEVKLNLCNSKRAKDPNVTHALIDRFAKHDLKSGKGTKQNPDFFYGFKADIWAAFGVGVTWLDTRGSGTERKNG